GDLRRPRRPARLHRARPGARRRAGRRRPVRGHVVRRPRRGRLDHRRRGARRGAAEAVRRLGDGRVSVAVELATACGIDLRNVTKVFPNGVKAVDDVSLEIRDGEFMVLVGPSGCGKSTLLRVIAGLEAVSAGRVLIGDDDVTDVRPQDRDLAMVFQNYALYPHMTVAANLSFGLRLRRMPKDDRDRRVLDVARTLGLDEPL